MPRITVNGAMLSYQEKGYGHGLPLLLLHAFPLTGESFRPQLEELSSRYRVIVPDLRGFGQSEVTEGPTKMSQLARDALGLLDALRIPAAVVGGVSMGGYAAMALLREAPQRVLGLALIDTQSTADDAAARRRREETAQAVLRDGMQVLVDSLLPKLLSPSASPEVRAAVEAMIRQNSPKGGAAALQGMALRPDSWDVLAQYVGPALVMVGERDAIIPVEKTRELSHLLAGSRLVIIPGAGHLPTLEDPDAVNKALDDFLWPLVMDYPSG